MPRKAEGLTAAKVRTASPGRYGDGGGLYLLVKPPTAARLPAGDKDGGRFWLFRYVSAGKMREMGLGPASGGSAVGLAEARIKARAQMDVVRDDRDPLAERDAAVSAEKAAAQLAVARAKTFRDVASLYIAGHEAGWRNAKHRAQWAATLKAYAYPYMGDLPVGDVATAHVMAALEAIWTSIPETAGRVRGRIEAILDYAKARDWRSGENPARWRGHIANMLPNRNKVRRVEHHAALPWREIGAFMASLRAQASMSARALEFTVLTAARTGETLGARWDEIDLRAAVWTVPGERMKAGKEHRVPLSGAVIELLTKLRSLRVEAAGQWVFHGSNAGQPLSNMAMTMLLRRMRRAEKTVHGFRSTFRDWAAETTSYSHEVAEAALAHTLSDKVEAAYRRGDLFDKRRRLMEDWATFCAQTAIEGANVIPIRIAG